LGVRRALDPESRGAGLGGETEFFRRFSPIYQTDFLLAFPLPRSPVTGSRLRVTASVGPTSAGNTIPPSCGGHIDMRSQAEVRSALRTATPQSLVAEIPSRKSGFRLRPLVRTYPTVALDS